LPVKGVVIGEAVSVDDIKGWASVIDKTWMLVGAGDFYTAILEKTHRPKPQQKIEWQLPHLYICGTAFNERKQFVKKIKDEGNCVSYLPETINEEWLEKTSNIIKEKKKVVIAIDDSTISASSLRTTMAKAVKEIVERENLKEIFIEGGSTAAAVLQELNIKKLLPLNELQRGVVRMKAFSTPSEVPKQSEGNERSSGEVDLYITVKPGSYTLPIEIIKLYS
jgi:D-threonate/D-erythronate kinase